MGNDIVNGTEHQGGAAPMVDPEWMYEVARRCQIIM